METELLVSSPWYRVTGQMAHKRHQEKFRLDIRKDFFTKRVVKHLKRFPREVANASSLLVFKSLLDNALNNVL